MSRLFKIFLIVVLSVFSSTNLSANDTFFSIEKSSERIEELANAGVNLSHFLDDAFVLSKRAEVIADGLPSQFPNLSIDELTSIKVYTSDEVRNGVKIYESLNTQLRAGNLDNYNQGLNQLLNSSLEKLPQYNGNKVFRGVYGQEATIAKTWNIGDDVTFKEFKSSSESIQEAAYKFSYNKGDNVVYEIVNSKGASTCGISCYTDEMEVMLNSGQKFEVKNIKNGFNISDPNDPMFNSTFKVIVLELLP